MQLSPRKKKLLIFASVSIVVIITIPFLFYKKTYPKHILINTNLFKVEVADNAYTLERGLSGHKPLKSFEGMLFIFDKPSRYGFWMKDMLFPIDIIWIDENYKVTHIEKSVSPDTYPKVFYPGAESLYVLEISAGSSDKTRLKIGDIVEIINID